MWRKEKNILFFAPLVVYMHDSDQKGTGLERGDEYGQLMPHLLLMIRKWFDMMVDGAKKKGKNTFLYISKTLLQTASLSLRNSGSVMPPKVWLYYYNIAIHCGCWGMRCF